jgi:hypothetical protein
MKSKFATILVTAVRKIVATWGAWRFRFRVVRFLGWHGHVRWRFALSEYGTKRTESPIVHHLVWQGLPVDYRKYYWVKERGLLQSRPPMPLTPSSCHGGPISTVFQ